MGFALDTCDWTTKSITIRCRHDDALIGDPLQSVKKSHGLIGLYVFHDFARRDDVELSEVVGCCIAVDEFVI